MYFYKPSWTIQTRVQSHPFSPRVTCDRIFVIDDRSNGSSIHLWVQMNFKGFPWGFLDATIEGPKSCISHSDLWVIFDSKVKFVTFPILSFARAFGCPIWSLTVVENLSPGVYADMNLETGPLTPLSIHLLPFNSTALEIRVLDTSGHLMMSEWRALGLYKIGED